MTASIINNLWKEPFMISSCKTVIQTDESFRETSPHGNLQYPFAFYLEDIWDFDFHTLSWHWHQEIRSLSFLWFRKAPFTVQSESGNLIWNRDMACLSIAVFFTGLKQTIMPLSPTLCFLLFFSPPSRLGFIRISFTLL